MAKVGVFTTPPRKYFGYDEDTEVELEFISKERMAKLIKRSDEAAKKVRGNSSLIYDMFLGKAAVLGWRHKDQVNKPGHSGLVLPGGAQLPFSEENRNMLMKSCAEFSSFVFRTCTTSGNFLDDAETSEEEPTLEELVNELDLDEEEGGPNV